MKVEITAILYFHKTSFKLFYLFYILINIFMHILKYNKISC